MLSSQFFSWTFNLLQYFLIDVVGSFLIAIARAVKKPFCLKLSTPRFSLKSSFSIKKIFLYIVCKETLAWFCIKQIIDSLLFLYLLLHIGLNFNIKHCLNNRANHENLDLSRFFSKNWTNQTKNLFKIIPYFASAPFNSACLFTLHSSTYFPHSQVGYSSTYPLDQVR